ncbi:fimbrial protein [Klebsiella indica]|uniref:Type 1 fimbrial protein n=1 Tax=Klebsiella indica TaxID=2582917 RepID=A0A5R9LPN8_9ENTR|nr:MULTISPECIES: fimbrial protein [Klebsiella]TLV21971.1 type 1 fimbrial protein [Klebsiella indica]
MRQLIASIVIIYSLFSATAVHAIGELIGGDLKFQGEVVAHGCSIDPLSKNVVVDFGEISARTLYAEGKSLPKAFVITLKDCSTAVFNSVTVTFSGTENTNMSDRLVVTGAASGIGIGFEESDGTAISLNVPTTALAISGTSMSLNFNAFVEGEPNALSNKTLQTGGFQATANYTLNYQ